jgi:hypothetical protein
VAAIVSSRRQHPMLTVLARPNNPHIGALDDAVAISRSAP